jgi:hypothetical protein
MEKKEKKKSVSCDGGGEDEKRQGRGREESCSGREVARVPFSLRWKHHPRLKI